MNLRASFMFYCSIALLIYYFIVSCVHLVVSGDLITETESWFLGN